jgi:hypothetical protein
MQERGFSVDSAGLRSMGLLVNTQLKVWVQQELLEQEALARRLDQSVGVARQLETWFESMLANRMKEYIRRQVSISESDVLTAMRMADSSVTVPRVQIRELRTMTLDDMQHAIDDLDRGASLEQVCGRWNSDTSLRLKKGISSPFRISERPTIGELAWKMEVGERYGPLPEGKEFVYFELLSKDSSRVLRDSTAAGARESALREVRRQKEKRTLDLFLAKTGATRGFMIYQDRVSRLKLSPVPMMTFRMLGFGGRMFAVPFVDPQIDWLNVEPPTGPIAF